MTELQEACDHLWISDGAAIFCGKCFLSQKEYVHKQEFFAKELHLEKIRSATNLLVGIITHAENIEEENSKVLIDLIDAQILFLCEVFGVEIAPEKLNDVEQK